MNFCETCFGKEGNSKQKSPRGPIFVSKISSTMLRTRHQTCIVLEMRESYGIDNHFSRLCFRYLLMQLKPVNVFVSAFWVSTFAGLVFWKNKRVSKFIIHSKTQRQHCTPFSEAPKQPYDTKKRLCMASCTVLRKVKLLKNTHDHIIRMDFSNGYYKYF